MDFINFFRNFIDFIDFLRARQSSAKSLESMPGSFAEARQLKKVKELNMFGNELNLCLNRWFPQLKFTRRIQILELHKVTQAQRLYCHRPERPRDYRETGDKSKSNRKSQKRKPHHMSRHPNFCLEQYLQTS